MKGMLKSITSLLCGVIVKSQIPRSARYKSVILYNFFFLILGVDGDNCHLSMFIEKKKEEFKHIFAALYSCEQHFSGDRLEESVFVSPVGISRDFDGFSQ